MCWCSWYWYLLIFLPSIDIKEDTVIVDFPECKGWKGIISEMELLPSKDTEGEFFIYQFTSEGVCVNCWKKMFYDDSGVLYDRQNIHN